MTITPEFERVAIALGKDPVSHFREMIAIARRDSRNLRLDDEEGSRLMRGIFTDD